MTFNLQTKIVALFTACLIHLATLETIPPLTAALDSSPEKSSHFGVFLFGYCNIHAALTTTAIDLSILSYYSD